MTVAESWRDSHLRTIIPESKALSKELVKFEHPPRILLVEDEKPIRDIIVPIVLSNLLLPEVDGLTLLLHVKWNHPRIPFVFETAVQDAEVRKAVMRNGADGFLLKPFESDQLLAIVRSVLGTG